MKRLMCRRHNHQNPTSFRRPQTNQVSQRNSNSNEKRVVATSFPTWVFFFFLLQHFSWRADSAEYPKCYFNAWGVISVSGNSMFTRQNKISERCRRTDFGQCDKSVSSSGFFFLILVTECKFPLLMHLSYNDGVKLLATFTLVDVITVVYQGSRRSPVHQQR